MGKRKQKKPHFADDTKRQQLQWNMTDQMSGTSSVICDDDKLAEENVGQEPDVTSTSEISSVNLLYDSSNSSSGTPLHALLVDTFYQNLAFCHSTLSIHQQNFNKINSTTKLIKFGQFKITLITRPNLLPVPSSLPEFTTCWLYVNNSDNSMLYFETEGDRVSVVQHKKTKSRESKFGIYWFVSLNVPAQILYNLKHKTFMLHSIGFDTTLKELTVDIFGTDGIILKLSHPSESLRMKLPQLAVQKLMEHFYDIGVSFKYDGIERSTGHDFFKLYESIMQLHEEKLSRDPTWTAEVSKIHHDCLKPTLRYYQKKSVAWMLRQERQTHNSVHDLHPLYCEITLVDGTVLYYNKHGGSFIKDLPKAIASLPGGILADEMGLGKTVEVLCCMLLHTRPDVSLPEPLPVIEDSPVDSEENTLSPMETSPTDTVVSDHSEDTARLLAVSTPEPAVSLKNEIMAIENSVKQASSSALSAGPQVCTDKVEVSFLNSKETFNLIDIPEGESLSGNHVIKVEGGASQECGSVSGHSPKVISLKSFNPALLNNVGVNNLSNQVSLLRLAMTSSSDDNSKSCQREKKKRKGYVEYIPVSPEESSYFSTKPMASKQFFECNCGQLDDEEETRKKGLHTMKCNLCGMSQHAECMNYDLHDPYRGEYLCPHCHATHTTIESGATLIISPYSICHQWIEEIHKHIKERTIKVFIYTGVSKLGYIQPQTLAQQDIVITTYDVLRKELDYANLPHTNSESGRRLRHPKRFLATPSPLVAVEWWRICLDEAQMVECVTTKTAEMALRLKAVNRWCVTGTPLMRSVEDIFGLLLFLGVDPLDHHQWFKLLLWEPFCHGFQTPMHEALQKVLWRTAKKDVINQIDLPLQTEEINWLTFSPMEEHFYRRQYEIYLRNAYTYRSRAQRLQDHSIKLHTLDRKTINELLNPLFRLRQACCHPQIVRGEFLPLNKTMMTMEELLEHMTKKVKTECEEAHRQIVASLNGMAGLAIIQGKLDKAVDKYRDVLRSVEEHKDQFRTDDLQQLHAMYNLAEMLEKKPEGVSPTLRDESLREQCTVLIEKYMSKTKINVASSRESLESVQISLKDITIKLRALDGDWWADIVDMTTQRGIEEELIYKVKDNLLRTSTTEGTIADSFHGAKGLMYVIDNHLQSMTKAHKGLTTGLEKLSKDTTPVLVQQAAVCCLRPVEQTLKTCPFCVVDELFKEYESKLFLFVERGVTVSGDDNDMAYLCLRSLWFSHREMISATDECEMATEKLRPAGQIWSQSQLQRYLMSLKEKDILPHELKLASEEICCQKLELKKKQGQLIYLMNLAKRNQDGDGSNPDLCPVCQYGLGVRAATILPFAALEQPRIERNIIGGDLLDRGLKCPMCRHLTPVRDISYVTTRKAEKVDIKVLEVIPPKFKLYSECLIKIREQDLLTAKLLTVVISVTAEMALRLKAVNRWCVTGTPLMRSVEDIFGLLLFLGVDPLDHHQWFKLLLWEPFCHGFQTPMHEALQKVLWRTAKKDVINQIDLPLQTEEINWLTFSPMEEHFYRRQYEIYLRNAYTYRSRAQRLQDHSIKLHTLDRKTINELLNPLFRLRQACCHPQIVRGEFLPLNKTMMTMEELLEHMTKKVKTECEEAHRQIVASLNGMAGLAIIQGKLDKAVDKYRDVLRSVEEHRDQFRTDDLQQLHAMYNLAEVLEKKPEGVSPTLRDESLREQCTVLIEKYMSKTKINVASSRESLESVQISLKDITIKLRALDGDWWADIVDMTTQRGIEEELIYKVKDNLLRTSTTEGTIADSFHGAKGLMYVIDNHLQSMTKAHKGLTTGLEKLSKDTTPVLVQQAAVCCLRPVEQTLKTCPFCVVDELFKEYESKLFLFVERGVTVSGDDNDMAYLVSTKRQGTWADSEVERALKTIHSFYRLQFDTDHDILEAANLQFKYLETLKKEFKCLRSLWLSHREMISATDECEMATEKLRLRTNLEPESATKIPNVIEEKDILPHELKLASEEIVARNELKKKQGQLIYLMNLAKRNQDGDGSNPDLCPVCQYGLGVEWSVLLCGHCFCLRCIRALIERNFIGGDLLDRGLKCPMCRHLTPVRDISYVTTRKAEKVDIKGSHSTKVQAVLECLIKIREQDPTAKSLVFSVWVSVLDILAAALAENKIVYKSLHDLNYFQRNLSAFKSEESIQVLLLPLHSGANGLNLVEANHVLLIEPELNLEEEAQAISRIYRIGQTRQTKIHRFLVRGTIEEKIYHMVKSLRESSSEASAEGVELTVGHITSLLQQPSPEDDDGMEEEEHLPF
ncbi:hypothetical protein Btru_020414 [Bulinus truncatus]|nr:hypothetical protein Btru_020414 [Bulinus truncatus]